MIVMNHREYFSFKNSNVDIFYILCDFKYKYIILVVICIKIKNNKVAKLLNNIPGNISKIYS